MAKIDSITQKLLEEGELIELEITNPSVYDHVFIFESFRVFYRLDGNGNGDGDGDLAPANKSSSNDRAIPDYIIQILQKFVLAKRLLIESFNLNDPLSSSRFAKANYIDLKLKNIPVEHGLTSDQVITEQEEVLIDSPYQGEALRIFIHRKLIESTATPIHELFHLFQYAYTPFNNMWFMEGLGRWSQSIIKKNSGKTEPLPQTENDLKDLLKKWHDAEFFWNQLTDLCESDKNFKIPHDIELPNNQRSGAKFMPVFLKYCEINTQNIIQNQAGRNIDSNIYWSQEEKRSANNNDYILRSIIEAVNEITPNPQKELQQFLNLIKPICNQSIEQYNTPEIQKLMAVLQKYRLGNVQINAKAILYSHYFDCYSQTLSIRQLSFLSSNINNDELACFSIVKNIVGQLTLSNNKYLTSLSGLQAIETIEGSLIIHNSSFLLIEGFESLERVKGKLEFSSNSELTDISGFKSLQLIDQSISIESNRQLQKLDGFSSLKEIKKSLLSVKNCPLLSEIKGFDKLKSVRAIDLKNLAIRDANFLNPLIKVNPNFVGSIKIHHTTIEKIKFLRGLKTISSSLYLHHNKIKTLDGLQQLRSVGASFSLSGNQLKSLAPLSNLVKVKGMLGLAHNDLSSLHGLENLQDIKRIKWNGHYRSLLLNNNPHLFDIYALSRLAANGGKLTLYIDHANFLLKPGKNSVFAQNQIEVLGSANLPNKSKLVNKIPKVKILFGNVWQHAVKKNSWIKAYHMKLTDVDQTISFCKENGIEVIFANNYNVQRFLQKNEQQFRAAGIHFIINSQFVIDNFVDKALFDQFMMSHELGEFIPKNYETDQDVIYPCVVKAKSGGAGRNVSLVYKAAELTGVDRSKFRVSEYLPGMEYATSVFYKNGEIIRHYTFGKSVEKEHYILQEHDKKDVLIAAYETPFLDIFTQIMQAANPNGETCQCSINYKIIDNQPKIFEINCRIGYTLATQANEYKQFMLFYIKETKQYHRFVLSQTQELSKAQSVEDTNSSAIPKLKKKTSKNSVELEAELEVEHDDETIDLSQFNRKKIILSPLELAEITGGHWENLSDDLEILEIHHTLHYLTDNNLFVVAYNDWPNASAYSANEHKIPKAIKSGACALLVRDDCVIDSTIPLLKVKNTYFALMKIAIETSHRSHAKRVLAVGSYGKTAFKLHLHDLLKSQVATYARRNSANYSASNLCNLASIKSTTELFIIEQPISSKSKMPRRAGYVVPDICILTSIGHEHIERFKTIDEIIALKTSVASCLPQNGKMIIPRDDRYYKKINKALKKYDNIQVLTFGSKNECNGRILSKQFVDFGWNITARIEDVVVYYKLPFPEEYAPNASLSVLLTAYHLGQDVYKAADNFIHCTNFKSSGNLYDISYKGINFQLYDQSERGGIEGYQSFFKTLSYLKPNNGGRKIVVTSEFVDYKDGEMELLDHSDFQQRIEASKIDILYTTEKFNLHQDVLKDKAIWRKHATDYKQIKDEVIRELKENDVLCVKGIFESNLPEFITSIKQLSGVKFEKKREVNEHALLNSSLCGLKTLKLSEKEEFNRAVTQAKQKGWCYYFPFLYFWSLSSRREVLIEEVEGSICIYLLRRFNGGKKPKLDLFYPPIPFNKKAMTHALKRINNYYEKKQAKIFWLDEEDVNKIKMYDEFNDLHIEYREDEYLFAAKNYQNIGIPEFKYIRRRINRAKKIPSLVVDNYNQSYKSSCLRLLEEWQGRQNNKYISVGDITYTKNCLDFYEKFTKPSLVGKVILIDNEVKGFGFIGEISNRYYNAFIAKTDHKDQNLGIYLKYLLFKECPIDSIINDSSDLGNLGLKYNKEKFLPISMHKVYKAYIK